MNSNKLQAFSDDEEEGHHKKPEEVKVTTNVDNGHSVIGQYNNPEMIDDLDLNAGYGSEEDYGEEFVDLDGMTDGLKLDNPHGLFMKQTNINQAVPQDKYAKYEQKDGDDSDEFTEQHGFDEEKFMASHKELLQSSPVQEKEYNGFSDEEGEGMPLDQFMDSLRQDDFRNKLDLSDEGWKEDEVVNSDDEQGFIGQKAGLGLNMPIMDDDFDIDHKKADGSPKNSSNSPQNKDHQEDDEEFGHLKILGSRFGKEKSGQGKAVNIRKGVSIEKTLRMKDDGKGGFTQQKEFDVIQHSQSDFSGVKGVLLENSRNPDKKSNAAMQSIMAAGGGVHLDYKETPESSDDEDDTMAFTPPSDNPWKFSKQFERWINIEGAKSQQENKWTVKVDLSDEPKLITEQKKEVVAPPKKKKLNRADFMFKAQKDQLLVKMPGDINGIDFKIVDLENCTVVILDHTAQITVDRCKNTKFYIGPIKASIFFRDCDGCDISVSCCQFRCRDLKNSRVHVYTPNDPIVESSSNLTFAPFNLKYPQLYDHSEAANIVGDFTDDDGVLQTKVNKWNKIFDFTKQENGELNFKIMEKEDFKIVHAKDLIGKEIPSDECKEPDFIFEIPVQYGGTMDDNANQTQAKDSLMAFDIRTGASAAQKAVDDKEEQKQIENIRTSEITEQTPRRNEEVKIAHQEPKEEESLTADKLKKEEVKISKQTKNEENLTADKPQKEDAKITESLKIEESKSADKPQKEDAKITESPKIEEVKTAEEPKKAVVVPPKKKKLNKADFMFKSQKDQLLVKVPGDINGIDFMIKDLDNCVVMLLDHTAQVTVDRCKNTKFYIGPIKASVFFRNCDDCEITVCCSQFRCRDLVNTKVYVYTPNDPIVESSSNVTFAPYNLRYPFLKEHSDLAVITGDFVDDDGKTVTKTNHWNQIFDFTKRGDGKLNFQLLDVSQFKVNQAEDLMKEFEQKYETPQPKTIEGSGSEPNFIFELPIEYGGTLDSSTLVQAKDSMQAFDIKTGAQKAQQAFDQKQNEKSGAKENINKMNQSEPNPITKPETNPITKPLKLKLLNNQNPPKKLVIKNLKGFLEAKQNAIAKQPVPTTTDGKISLEHASLLSIFKNNGSTNSFMKARHSLVQLSNKNDLSTMFDPADNETPFDMPKIKKIKLKTRGNSSKDIKNAYNTNVELKKKIKIKLKINV